MQISDINYVVVFITVSSLDEAKKISANLIDNKLAACVNIVPSVQSFFHWQGKVCDEQEILLVVKTRLNLFESLELKVKELHSYDVPEIIALPIIAGSKEYLKWVGDETMAS